MKLFKLDGTTVVSFNGSVVREHATRAEAITGLARLNGFATLKATADLDEDPKALAGAIDAVLDACGDLIAANDVTALPAWAQQMVALVVAAETTVDELLEALGVPDPDNLDPETSAAASIKKADRDKMAKTGVALPDGSFPIPDASHLKSAIKLARTPAHKAHIKKRAKALGKDHMIPSEWSN